MNQTSDPTYLYTAEQVRVLDRRAIALGISGFELMSRAGDAAFRQINKHWPEAESVLVLCGPGNNGGDGYVVAELAGASGIDVHLVRLGEVQRISGDAATARERFLAAGGREIEFSGELPAADVVVDALLGTGLERPVEGEFAAVISAANRLAAPRVAIDIPSGLHADSGRVLGVALDADLTVTFIGFKRGLFTGQAAEHCGQIVFDDLAVPPETFREVHANAVLLTGDLPRSRLRPRPRAAHKGMAGRVLVIGGDHGMSGAPRMAGEAALRVGAGLVMLGTRAEHAHAHAAARPELMCHALSGRRDMAGLAEAADVLAVGPGLGSDVWGRELFTEILTLDKPLVVDADGLNLLARDPRKLPHAVFTPHPGEAARLLGCGVDEVQVDRFEAARQLRRRYGGVVVLKGSGTLIAGDEDEPVAVCALGNPGMASGGMGDVLTGVIAALLAQGLSPRDAAEIGVCLHAQAGDAAAGEGERGMIATDLMPWLRRGVNP